MNNTKYIFVTGGVMSSLGKGLCASACASLLQNMGFSVRVRKMDPYINVDPGTMSPEQHGEVFVTEDGTETDMDFGHYERFTSVQAKRGDNITTGKVYSDLIVRERKGEYLGKTVQIIPHLIDLIKSFVTNKSEEVDFLICEIGGTVGDIEGQPFFETIRQIGKDLGQERVCYIHLTFVPYINITKEFKTKPTQHSVKELNSIGINPDIIICRSEKKIPNSDCRKISLLCNVSEEQIISAENIDNIYKLPVYYSQSKLHHQILKKFNLKAKKEPDYSTLNEILNSPTYCEVRIALIGKYVSSPDAYRSVIESLIHASFKNKVLVNIDMLDSRDLDFKNIESKLKSCQGILVPGGFGDLGVDGKIHAIKYARENNIPFLGICLGMQLAIIEAARNILNLREANSTEFDQNCAHPVVGLLSEWMGRDQLSKNYASLDIGGSMRLGSYECILTENSIIQSIYNRVSIYERHRHRYEVNSIYLDRLESIGYTCVGKSKDGLLLEAFENINHPWFIGVQFHPEFKSTLYNPSPIFSSFVEASSKFKE